MYCQCHDYQNHIMNLHDVLPMLENAVENKQAFSLTRFSHAEISYMSWEIDPFLIKLIDRYRVYNGMTDSLENASGQLLHSLKMTDIVGFVPQDCQDGGEWWYAKTKQLLHHLDMMPESICSVWASHDLVGESRFWDFLKKHRVALIGRRAEEAAPYFSNEGVKITVTKSLNGIQEIENVHEALKTSSEWDIALVSAGIPATILTPRLADDTGRVVIDFGHAIDLFIDKDHFNFQHLVDQLGRDSGVGDGNFSKKRRKNKGRYRKMKLW